MIKEFVWFKGGLVRRESAVVSVFSPTAQFGLNVFEGLNKPEARDISDKIKEWSGK